MAQLVASITFSHEFYKSERDANSCFDQAAAELWQAGYEVLRMPDNIVVAWRLRTTILWRRPSQVPLILQAVAQ
jgi:hypothetical protein